MDSRANVKSFDALLDFAKALASTQADLVRQAEAVRIELDRITNYLERDAPTYWKREYTRAQERLEVARAALSRCEQVTREDDRRSCMVEKKQVAIAKQRLDFCEARLRSLKPIGQNWQQAKLKTQAHLQQVLDIAETGLPTAQVTLQQIMNSLKNYASLGSEGPPHATDY